MNPFGFVKIMSLDDFTCTAMFMNRGRVKDFNFHLKSTEEDTGLFTFSEFDQAHRP